jgi:hypothetical protein
MTDDNTTHLLRLAAVLPSNNEAIAWLSEAIESARRVLQPSEQRPSPIEHNAPLIEVEKSTNALTKSLDRLRRHSASWRAFWRSPAFGPVHHNRVEIAEVISTLDNIRSAAEEAQLRRKGRPPAGAKQQAVDLALGFYIRFSRNEPSGTPTGNFAEFARAFFAAASGIAADEVDGLDRQIRKAMKRLPIERQRAQRKSAQKT